MKLVSDAQDIAGERIGLLGVPRSCGSRVQLGVGTSHETEIGTTAALGELETGSELEFAIVVMDTGHTYYRGPAERNADGFKHVAITYVGDCLWVVGFEDQEGGGDQDFNDVQLTISGPLELRPVE